MFHACQVSPNQSVCSGPRGRVDVAVNVVGQIVNAVFEVLSLKTIVRLPLFIVVTTPFILKIIIFVQVIVVHSLGVVSAYKYLVTICSTEWVPASRYSRRQQPDRTVREKALD